MTAGRGATHSDQSVHHVAVLRDLGHRLAQPMDMRALLHIIHDETARILDTTIFILGLYDPASQTVEVIGQIIAGIEQPGGSFPLGSGFTSQVIRTRQSRLIRDWSRSGPAVQLQYATDQPGLPESGMTVPLIHDDRVLGVLTCQSYRPDAYDDSDLMTFEAIAGQVASAIERMRGSERLNTQLRRRISELETILTSMTDALLIVDANGCIVRLNKAARALLLVDDTSIIYGQPLNRERWGQWPLGAREIAEALEPLIAALQQGETVDDVVVTFGKGERRIFSFSGSPLYDPVGGVTAGVIVFRDITERHVIEQLKDEILAIASHDLKTPISAIKGQAQILARRVETGRVSSNDLVEGLATITRQSDRLVDLLDTLLNLSHIEAGRLQLNPEHSDLVRLVNASTEAVQATTNRHQLRVQAPERIEGVWDSTRLQQVLQNLLANAVKYSPDGGAVHVTVESDEEQVTVCVQDEGIGIHKEDIPHLFDRFYRVAETRGIEGAGLGLYISHGIIAAHGGRIWAESLESQPGSRFCFTVPRHQST